MLRISKTSIQPMLLAHGLLLILIIYIIKAAFFSYSRPLEASTSSDDLPTLHDPHGFFQGCEDNGFRVLRICNRILRNIRYEAEAPIPARVVDILDLFYKQDRDRSRGIVSFDSARRIIELDRTKPYRVVAMAIYGSNVRYTYGLLRNAISLYTDKTFRGWKLRVYYDHTVPNQLMHLVQEMGAELYLIKGADHTKGFKDESGMFWRFLILMDDHVTRYIVRDADAYLSLRDQRAVDEWASFDPPYFFHSQRDHPDHKFVILGGMWGAIGGFLDYRSRKMFESLPVDDILRGRIPRRADQDWLAKVIWPAVKNSTLSHDSFLCRRYDCAKTLGYPVCRTDKTDFVGNIFEPGNKFTGRVLEDIAPAECRRNPEWIYG